MVARTLVDLDTVSSVVLKIAVGTLAALSALVSGDLARGVVVVATRVVAQIVAVGYFRWRAT